MNTAMLILALALAQGTPKPPTFAEVFDLQVDATNEAVRAYGNALCTDSDFAQLTINAKRQYGNLAMLHNTIPQDEDEDTRIKQTELFIGLRFVTAKIADRQNKCLYDSYGPDHHQKPTFPPMDQQ